MSRDGKPRDVQATLAAEELATWMAASWIRGWPAWLQRAERARTRARHVRRAGRRGGARGSRAGQAGLQANDQLIGIGNRRIASVRALQVLAGAHLRQLALAIADDEGMHYVVVQ